MTESSGLAPVAGMMERAVSAVSGTWLRVIGSVLVVAVATAVIAGLPGAMGQFVSGWLEAGTPSKVIKLAPQPEVGPAAPTANGAIGDEVLQKIVARLEALEGRAASQPDHEPKINEIEGKIAALKAEKAVQPAPVPRIAPLAPVKKPPVKKPAPAPKAQPASAAAPVKYWPWE